MVVIQALVALLWAHVHKARGEVADAKKQLEQGEATQQQPRQQHLQQHCCKSGRLQWGVDVCGTIRAS
jgi:hypothetical protein